MIKSGGEWISSVELENQVMAHPDVFEAAVIGVPDERYDERPLVVVVPCDGRKPEPSEILEFPRPAGGEMVAPREVGIRGRAPEDERGQVRQEGVCGSKVADGAIEVQQVELRTG